jgi:hypothetical protein
MNLSASPATSGFDESVLAERLTHDRIVDVEAAETVVPESFPPGSAFHAVAVKSGSSPGRPAA